MSRCTAHRTNPKTESSRRKTGLPCPCCARSVPMALSEDMREPCDERKNECGGRSGVTPPQETHAQRYTAPRVEHAQCHSGNAPGGHEATDAQMQTGPPEEHPDRCTIRMSCR